MKLAWFAACSLCLPAVEASYNLFHAVDPMPVVCPLLPAPSPLPPGITKWPDKKEFQVPIEPNNGMLVDKPHIVTFMRTTEKALKIGFHVKDATGKYMIRPKTVDLKATQSRASIEQKCQCTGLNTNVDTAFYGASYGKTCAAHDDAKCKTFWPGLESEDVCCKSWCYVPGDCPTAFQSRAAPGLYWSYDGVDGATKCASVPKQASCKAKYTTTADKKCKCKNVDVVIQNSIHAANFSAGYGAQCKTWDFDNCADVYAPDVIDSWCCEGWCWTDEECESSIPSKVWIGLHWTTKACPDDQEKVRECPFKAQGSPEAKDDTRCECIGYSPGVLTSGRRRAGKAFPSTYGGTCSAWDKQYCDKYWPNHNTGMWCCQSWCYVDEACPSANPSWIIAGHFYSYDYCNDTGSDLAACTFGDACKPTGTNTGLGASDIAKFGADYGKSCGAWDAANCAANYPTQADWCCKSWAYVSKECPIAKDSDLSSLLFWSYEICPDGADSKWNAASNSCTTPRRLAVEAFADDEDQDEDQDEDEVEKTDETEDEDEELSTGRRLKKWGSSSRRRSGGSWSSSGSPRRRWSARRRVPVSSPRRRSPRRRAPARPPATPRRRVQTQFSPRRRAPVAPAPPPPPRTSPRRRDIGHRRRRTTTGAVGASGHRRRTSVYGSQHTVSGLPSSYRRRQPYGYTNQQAINQNYYGNTPYQQSYGYSGYAYNPGYSNLGNPSIKLGMAVGAGVLGGAVLGAGAYYAYSQYNDNNWAGDLRDQSWCGNPSGRQMLCNDCYQKHGSTGCSSRADCYNSESGCNYKLTQATLRDDLIDTGVIPEVFTAPYTITVTSIEGDDFTPTKICPKKQPDDIVSQNWESASSFGTDLFVTFTEMDVLGDMPVDGTANLAGSRGLSMVSWMLLALFLLRGLFVHRS